MRKKIFVQLLASIILITFLQPIWPMSPDVLKGTYAVFEEPYRYLSPLNGALLWEGGVVKHYYDAGTIAQTQPGQWLPNTDGPIRLARALFTDTLGNFDVSTNTNYPAKHMGISTIANIIAFLELNHRNSQPITCNMLEDLIISDTAFACSVRQTDHEHKTTHKAYATQMAECEARGQQDMVQQLRNSSAIALNKLSTKRLHQDWTRHHTILELQRRIEQIDQLTGIDKMRAQKERYTKDRKLEQLLSAKSGNDCNRVRELAGAIIDACIPSAYYPPHCALSLLMAFMYRKATGKHDLACFINTLAEKLGPSVCKAVSVPWTQDLFSAKDLAAVKQRVARFNQTDLKEVSEPALYEATAWAQIIERFYRGTFPKIAEYTNVCIQDLLFPDCVEVTLRNFCNMIFYDRPSGIFDVHRAGHGIPDKAMADFYADPINRSANAIEIASVHHAWDRMLQNLPLITYRMLILQAPGETKTILSAPKDTNGFIYGLPENILKTLPKKGDRILIAERWYIHVNQPNAYLCEMHPTIRNVIIILNRLFNLNLFADLPLADAFLLDHFNAHYFPRLCEHFELLRGMKWTEPLLMSLERDEYTDKGVHLIFTNFDLILTDEHAEIISNVKGDTIADLGPHIINMVSRITDSPTTWQLTQLLSIFPIEVAQLPQINPHPYLWYLPLYNNQTKINAALFCIKKLSEPELSATDRRHYTDRAISYIRQLPERLDWHYHEDLIHKLDAQALTFMPIAQEIERILSVAKGRLKRDSAECEYVPALYTALIAKGYNRDDVMIVIDNLLLRPEQFDRRPLLNLLIALAKQGKAHAQARKAVELCINNSIQAERQLAKTLSEIVPI